MRITKRVFCGLLLALVASLAIAVLPAYADDATYKVRVWGGNEGVFKDQTDAGYAEKSFEYGSTINLQKEFGEATVTNPKYYFRGFRVSGEDGLIGAVTVESDLDFVAAYGVEGEMVPYTLHFVDHYNTSKELALPQTYYGKVGDKPVAAFEYIEGYRPLYRNITGTLQPEGNDWTFEYVPLETGENEGGNDNGGGNNGGNEGGNDNGGGNNGGNDNGGGNEGGNNGGTEGGNDNGGGNEGGNDNGGGNAAGGNAAGGNAAGGNAEGNQNEGDQAGNQNAAPPTEEILDVDNPRASGVDDDKGKTKEPKSEDDGKTTDPKSGSPAGMGIPIGVIYGVAALIVAAVAAIFVAMRRRQG